jgi:hypothetical protein
VRATFPMKLNLLFKSTELLRYTALSFSILIARPSLSAAQSTPVTYSTPDYVYPDNNGYYKVTDEPYGCYGDRRHDDTACIKAAMDAAMRVRPTSVLSLKYVHKIWQRWRVSDQLFWSNGRAGAVRCGHGCTGG